MSAVCVLTPIVIGSWPMIASAIAGAAGSMGFALAADDGTAAAGASRARTVVETTVPNCEIVAEVLERGERVRIERDGVTVEFGVDDRGACTVCVSGAGYDRSALARLGEAVAGRVVQQFAYHKLVAELKARRYEVVEEGVEADASIRMRVKLNR